jgi:tripartite-type tricarboxylate transporter receptor subunit TctC
MIRKLALLLLTAVALGAVQPALAEDYPTRPIRIVVPFPPGAGNDLLGRLMAEQLTTRLGQSVFVENKAGAGSQIGIDLVAKSKPDGYNLVLVASDGLSILPAVRPAIPYKVPDDFSFIAGCWSCRTSSRSIPTCRSTTWPSSSRTRRRIRSSTARRASAARRTSAWR